MQAAKVGSGSKSENASQLPPVAVPVDVPAVVPGAAVTPTPAAPVDSRYPQAMPNVPAVAIGPPPPHVSKPSSIPGAPAVVIRPPKQITGASPKAPRNGADSFGHAEPSPTPDTSKAYPGLAQHINGLVEAVAAQAEAVSSFTTLVEHARAAQATDQEQLYVSMGTTQVDVFTTLQQQVKKALGDMREQLAGASDVALSVAERWGQVNSIGKANLARWEQVVGPAAGVHAVHAGRQV